MTGAGLRLAVGLLTVLPAAPHRVDRSTAGAAMLLTPVVGLILAGIVGAVGVLAAAVGLSAALTGVLCLAALATLSRGLHLDGLADTADALASGRRPAEALAVMRRSDIGPFGVVTLVLVLLVQAAAAAQLLAAGAGPAALVAAVLGRAMLVVACVRGVPAARPDGLGALVAGSVRRPAASAVLVGTVAALEVAGRVFGVPLGAATAATVVAALVTAGVLRHCRRRLGGVTGDVLGAVVELSQTAALVVLTALAG